MEPVRFGLIGYGAWGSHHARATSKTHGAQLAAIADRSAERRTAASVEFPNTRVFADYRDVLGCDDLDVLDVVLPSDLHYEVAKAALQAGRHLFLEKPMALSLEHCDELIALAKERQLLLAIDHELRLSSLWSKVKAMIDAGAIGEPLYCLIELWRDPYRQGSDGWRYDIRRVGNWVLEEPIHFFDLARWYFSKVGEPVSVYARANGKRAEHPELHDNFTAILGFPDGKYAVVSQTLAGYEHHQVAKVTGTGGALWAAWSGATGRTFHPIFSLKHFDGEKAHDIPVARITGEVYELEEQIARMVGAVREGKPLCATGEDGRWSVAMCLKAQESVDSGKAVRFP